MSPLGVAGLGGQIPGLILHVSCPSHPVSQLPTVLMHPTFLPRGCSTWAQPLLEKASASLLSSDFWRVPVYSEPNVVVLELAPLVQVCPPEPQGTSLLHLPFPLPP